MAIRESSVLIKEIQDDKPMKGGRGQPSTITFTSVRGKMTLKTPSSLNDAPLTPRICSI